MIFKNTDRNLRRKNFTKTLSKLRINDLDDKNRDSKSIQYWKNRLRGSDLRGCDFSGLKLDGFDFSRAQLEGANFQGSQLKSTKFRGSELGITELRKLLLRCFCFFLAWVAGLICAFSFCGFAVFAASRISSNDQIAIECQNFSLRSEIIQYFQESGGNLTDNEIQGLYSACEKYEEQSLYPGTDGSDEALEKAKNRSSDISIIVFLLIIISPLLGLIILRREDDFNSFLLFCVGYVLLSFTLILFLPNIPATIALFGIVLFIGVFTGVLAQSLASFIQNQIREHDLGAIYLKVDLGIVDESNMSTATALQNNLQSFLTFFMSSIGVTIGTYLASKGTSDLSSIFLFVIAACSIYCIFSANEFSKRLEEDDGKYAFLSLLFMLVFAGSITNFRGAEFDDVDFSGAIIKGADFSLSNAKGPLKLPEISNVSRVEDVAFVIPSTRGITNNYISNSHNIEKIVGPVAFNGIAEMDGNIIEVSSSEDSEAN
jgi:uncharacterized protein YjbI with pentapeptide repeats